MPVFPTIAGFEFIALLGRGGMAAVYRARQPALGREVAIKVVDPQDGASDEYLQRLENEAQSLAGLGHPNIVVLHQFGRTAEGALYYVMPLLTGGDLSRWPKPVEEARLVPLLDTLLDALAHAHAADVIHRDIKPENILFDPHGRPLLADFGAAFRRSKPRTTLDGMAIGSTGYMSPEQARGAVVDARSDLYSLAVLAFEMLTGRLPFDGPDPLAVALAQVEQPVPRLPPPLAHWQAWFERALAIDPAARFARAEDMRDGLRELQPLARPAVPPARLRWYHGAAAALVLIPLLASLWLTHERPVDPGEIAALLAESTLLPPAEPNALDRLREARRQAPDDRVLLALQAQLFDLLAMRMTPALQAEDLAGLPAQWQGWRQAVASLDAGHSEAVRIHEAAVEARLQERLETASARYDRTLAAAALDLLDAWPEASPALLALAAEVRRLPLEGERFSDPDGPELLLVRRPQDDERGLAVMAAALQPALYQRFASATRRRLPNCPGQPEMLQACVGLDDAEALADWLSAQSGARYRVPTRRELASVIAHVEPAPLHAWTRTCNEVTTTITPNVAKRAWGGIRSVFGGERAQARIERRCDGHLALPLDGRGSVARAFEDASAQTTVVLLREVAATQR